MSWELIVLQIAAPVIVAAIIGGMTALFTGWVNGKVINTKFEMYRDHTDESITGLREDVKAVHKRLDAFYQPQQRRKSFHG